MIKKKYGFYQTLVYYFVYVIQIIYKMQYYKIKIKKKYRKLKKNYKVITKINKLRKYQLMNFIAK